MANEVKMDTDRIEQMAGDFSKLSQLLRNVAKFLEKLMHILDTTAFIGLVGGYAVRRYLSFIKPQVENMAEYFDEISKDLKLAVQHFMAGDQQGASRFF